MDYEKKYKEALERAKELQHDNCWITSIFPEIKESEDERIRKEIIEFIKVSKPFWKDYKDYSSWVAWLEKQVPIYKEKVLIGARKDIALSIINFLDRNTLSMCLSNMESADLESAVVDSDWSKVYDYMKKKLEKQGEQKSIIEMQSPEESLGISYEECNDIVDECLYGEQKSADKVESKFKVGDWISNGRYAKLITGINSDWPHYMFNDGTSERIKDIDKKYHIWNIQEAKDGDALAAHECIVLFKEIDGLNIKCHCALHILGLLDDTSRLYIDTLQNKTAFHPANKEQRELLFVKMKEAGYDWNAEQKELKKIHVIDEGKAEMDYCFTKMMNGDKVSSAWSEEDERMYIGLYNLIYSAPYCDSRKEFSNWLKSIKDRMKGE